MRVEITRTYQDKQTIGILRVMDNYKSIFECKSLELKWNDNKPEISCIPKGKYYCKKNKGSNKINYPHFDILGVSGRGGIKIHAGNFVTEIKGCVLIGNSFADLNGDGLTDVLNSRKTLERLYEILPETFDIIIE